MPKEDRPEIALEEIVVSLRRDSHALDAVLHRVELMAMNGSRRIILLRLSAAVDKVTQTTADLLSEVL